RRSALSPQVWSPNPVAQPAASICSRAYPSAWTYQTLIYYTSPTRERAQPIFHRCVDLGRLTQKPNLSATKTMRQTGWQPANGLITNCGRETNRHGTLPIL